MARSDRTSCGAGQPVSPERRAFAQSQFDRAQRQIEDASSHSPISGDAMKAIKMALSREKKWGTLLTSGLDHC